jgi:hypothetical protein
VEDEQPPVPPSGLPSEPEALPPPIQEPFFVPPAVALAPPPVPETPAYKDRGTGLIIFGIFQIILGMLAALMVPLMALSAAMSHLAPGGAMRPGQYVSAILTYIFVSAIFIALGVGSVQMKRWARALTLISSWYWLIVGALATVLMTAVLPVMMRTILQKTKQTGAAGPSPEMTTGIMAFIVTFVIVFIAFFLVIVPLIFVVFYGRKDVELTCRDRDPVERWTDRVPLPVLGASMVFFAGAAYMFLVALTTPMAPFFGIYLTGIKGAFCLIVIAALDLYLSVAFFRLRAAGWWVAVIFAPIRLLSMAITYSRGNLMEAYSKIGMSDEQVNMMSSNPMFSGHVVLWWSLVSAVLFFGYLLWLKRYFKAPVTPTPVEVLPTQLS